MQCIFQPPIATKWLEVSQDNLRMKFSALNVDFNIPSPDSLGSRSWRKRASKTAPPKKWLFYRNYLV